MGSQSFQSKTSTYHPYFFECAVILQRDYVLRERDELEIVRRDVDLSQHAFLFQDPVDQGGNAWDEYEGVCVLLRLLRVPFDLICVQKPIRYGRWSGRVLGDLPATILILRMKGRQRYTTLVVVEVKGPDSSQNILSTPWCFQQMSGWNDLAMRTEVGLTFSRDTSVTRPNGPAIELSSTSVFAPLTFERKSVSSFAFTQPRDVAEAHRVQRVDQSLSPNLLKHGNVWTGFFILFQSGEMRDPLFVLGRVRGSHVTWR